jgi:hypothetical protein
VVVASDQSTFPVTASAGTNLNTSALALETTQTAQSTLLGAVNETAPATDTASSGLNGRQQRIAQRLSSLIALIPASLGQKTMANALAVVIASDQSTIPVSNASLPLPAGASTETTLGTRLSESDFDTKTGSLTEAAPASDTASSGLNGRLQRIAQRITSLIALVPTSLGQKTMANSFAVVLASDQASVPVSATIANAIPAGTNLIGTVLASGNVNHNSADAGAPNKIGYKTVAQAATPTFASAAGNRSDALGDLAGRAMAIFPVTWTQVHTPAVNTQATTSKAAGAAGVRHVCNSISASLYSGSTAVTVPAAPVTVILRDGATGAGTILWQQGISVPTTAGGSQVINISGLNIIGTAATAMTLEFSGAGGAGSFESVHPHGLRYGLGVEDARDQNGVPLPYRYCPGGLGWG